MCNIFIWMVRINLMILLVLLSFETVIAQSFNAVVLMYHRFGEDRYPATSIRLDQFDKQLSYLEKNGFSVVPLTAVVKALEGKGTLPDDAVAITVDDAYRSVYENAFPRLKARNWPFTVFVSTDAVDKKFKGMLTWDQMREMASQGVTFANHTASHAHLTVKRPQESETEYLGRIRGDIERAQKRLEKELGSAPMWFAYPYGEYSERIADLVKSMGYVAFGQQSGAIGPLSDTRALPRFPMNESYGNMKGFKQKIRSLAMPVTKISPFNPVTSNPRPRLEIALAKNRAQSDRLACFVSGQGLVKHEWVAPGRCFSVRAQSDLPPGRNRYNCTMPNRDGSRYYWFSQQWVVEQRSSP